MREPHGQTPSAPRAARGVAHDAEAAQAALIPVKSHTAPEIFVGLVGERRGSEVSSQRHNRRPDCVGLGGRGSRSGERAYGHAELGQDVGIGNLRCRPDQSE